VPLLCRQCDEITVRRFHSTTFAALAAIFAASPLVAQECALQIGSRVVEVGESIDAQLVCTNTGRPSAPEFTAPDGIELRIMNPTPMMSSMTSIVNGRSSQRTTYTFPLRLTGQKAGSYTLGPIKVQGDGQTYEVPPLQINVQNTMSSTRPEGDQILYATLTVEPTSVYVTQTVTATLTIGIRKVYVEDQMVEFDQLLQTIDASGSTLSVFGPRFNASQMWMTDSSGKRHQYLVYRDTKEVRAEEVGTTQIGPIFLRANYPVSFRRSFWGQGLEPSRTTRLTARAEAITVTVNAAPSAGRPADFTGAIGQYTMNVSAKPDRVEQGQPITVTIAISGSPVEGVAGPNLAAQPELASRFDFTGDEMTGDVERQGVKVFRRAIFPKQVGEQTVPPITWSYFDPNRESYVTLASQPVPVAVDPPSGASAATTSLESTPPDSPSTKLTVLRGGISPNYVDTDGLLANQVFSLPMPVISGILAAPPLAWLVTLFTVRRRLRLRSDVSYARRRKAMAEGRAGLQRAMRAHDPREQLAGVGEAVTTYLAHRFDLPPGAITPGEARSLLVERLHDEPTADELAGFLSDCDALRYAPGVAAKYVPAVAAKRAREWFSRIERNGA
jgi:hypothetical protein